MTAPSDAAVEAAAEELREYDSNIDAAWKYPDAARAALSAALPIIREELAQELIDNITLLDLVPVPASDRDKGMWDAARIVRGQG